MALHLMEVLNLCGYSRDALYLKEAAPDVVPDNSFGIAFVFCDPDLTFQSQAEFMKDKNQHQEKYKAGRYTFWDDSRPIFDLVEPPRQLTMQIVEPETDHAGI